MNVARGREPGQTIKQITSDFGIAEPCPRNWLRQADVEDGLKPGTTAAENDELHEAKRRIRLLEQEKLAPAPCCGLVVAGESAGKMMYPLARELASDGIPSR